MIPLQIVLSCTAQGLAGRKPTIAWVGEHGQKKSVKVERFVPCKLGLKRTKAMGMILHLITSTYTAVKHHYMESNIDIICSIQFSKEMFHIILMPFCEPLYQ